MFSKVTPPRSKAAMVTNIKPDFWGGTRGIGIPYWHHWSNMTWWTGICPTIVPRAQSYPINYPQITNPPAQWSHYRVCHGENVRKCWEGFTISSVVHHFPNGTIMWSCGWETFSSSPVSIPNSSLDSPPDSKTLPLLVLFDCRNHLTTENMPHLYILYSIDMYRSKTIQYQRISIYGGSKNDIDM